MVRAAVHRCPLCGSRNVLDLLRIDQVPIYCNVLYSDEYEARTAARGDLALGYCVVCAHLFNTAFDPRLTEYTPAYDSSLHYSPCFNRYAEELAARLIERYALRGKRIVEIGCGKGDFLRMLCTQGANRGFGFDRSFEPGLVTEAAQGGISFFQEFYDEEYAGRCRPDFVCCRHVLEHVQHPLDFLVGLRRTLEDRREAALYFEVPNGLFTLKDMGIWDLIYEHCAYFSLNGLITAFTRTSFDVVAGDEAFGGQFIWIEARPGLGGSHVKIPRDQLPNHVREYADAFTDKYWTRVKWWRQQVVRIAQEGRRAVVWGGGSKGVTFLNGLKDCDAIRYVVDVNPHKQGRYVAGTAQRVVAPDFLRVYRPTDVIVMNPLYLDEITSAIRAMGLAAKIVGV